MLKMRQKHVTIVGFGNSITEAVVGIPDERQRWLSLLKQYLAAAFPQFEFQVINSGIGGNSAREAMTRFGKDVLSHAPDFVILEFGGNNEDLARPERIVRPAEFRELLEKYAAGLPAQTKTIVVTFPPVLDDLHAYGKNPAFTEYYRQAGGIDKTVGPYRKLTVQFALEHGFPLYDLHRELLELGRLNGRLTYTLSDGIHLTADGNKVLAGGVFEILKTILSEVKLCQD